MRFGNNIYEIFLDIKYYFMSKFYELKEILHNIKLYYPIIKNDRWWDFAFFEELIIHKLKDLEKHWGVDTHYVGDSFTKKRIQVLLRKWEKIQKFDEKNPFNKETEKMKIKWFKELGRLMPRLWD